MTPVEVVLSVAVSLLVLVAGLLVAGWWRCRCCVDCGCVFGGCGCEEGT